MNNEVKGEGKYVHEMQRYIHPTNVPFPIEHHHLYRLPIWHALTCVAIELSEQICVSTHTWYMIVQRLYFRPLRDDGNGNGRFLGGTMLCGEALCPVAFVSSSLMATVMNK
jgi:hypothetical protein